MVLVAYPSRLGEPLAAKPVLVLLMAPRFGDPLAADILQDTRAYPEKLLALSEGACLTFGLFLYAKYLDADCYMLFTAVLVLRISGDRSSIFSVEFKFVGGFKPCWPPAAKKLFLDGGDLYLSLVLA